MDFSLLISFSFFPDIPEFPDIPDNPDYPKNIYAMAIAAMMPAKSASRPQVTAWRVLTIPTLPK
jgi:hypothetical protein